LQPNPGTKEKDKKVRVFELAKDLNLASKDLIALAQELGYSGLKNQLNTLEPDQIDALKDRARKGPAKAAGVGAPAAPGKPVIPAAAKLATGVKTLPKVVAKPATPPASAAPAEPTPPPKVVAKPAPAAPVEPPPLPPAPVVIEAPVPCSDARTPVDAGLRTNPGGAGGRRGDPGSDAPGPADPARPAAEHHPDGRGRRDADHRGRPESERPAASPRRAAGRARGRSAAGPSGCPAGRAPRRPRPRSRRPLPARALRVPFRPGRPGRSPRRLVCRRGLAPAARRVGTRHRAPPRRPAVPPRRAARRAARSRPSSTARRSSRLRSRG
jgi:hypothetical protein